MRHKVRYTAPMRFTPQGKLIREDIWREGEYLDLWSVPHFLSGLAVGLGLHLSGLDMLAGVLVAFVLLSAYELFEYVADIDEGRANAILDIVVGMGSCVLALTYAPQFPHDRVWLFFTVVLLTDGILSFLGWRESRKAAVLEARFRAEWQKERARMRERRSKIAAKLRSKNSIT